MKIIQNFLSPSYQNNIPKFFIYWTLNNFMLSLPVWVIFLQGKHGVSLTQVTLIDVAFWMTMALTEVPTGAFADTLGRKQSQLIGVLLTALANFGFALAPSFPWVVAANSLWAVAVTFISGAELAFFYDTLRELGREADYPKFRGQLQAVALISIGISAALGGVIGQGNLMATFLISGCLLLVAAVMVALFKEPPRETDAETGQSLGYWQTLKVSFNAVRRTPGLRFALLYSAFLPMVIAPIRLTFLQPYVVGIGLPIAALGFVSIGIRGFQVIGSLNAKKVVARLGEWNWLRLSPLIIFVGILGVGFFGNLGGIGIFAVTAFASAASRPLTESLILRQTPGSVRATILSLDSLVSRLILSGAELTLGTLADGYGLSPAFVISGVGFGVLILALMVFWGKVWVPPEGAEPQKASST